MPNKECSTHSKRKDIAYKHKYGKTNVEHFLPFCGILTNGVDTKPSQNSTIRF